METLFLRELQHRADQCSRFASDQINSPLIIFKLSSLDALHRVSMPRSTRVQRGPAAVKRRFGWKKPQSRKRWPRPFHLGWLIA